VCNIIYPASRQYLGETLLNTAGYIFYNSPKLMGDLVNHIRTFFEANPVETEVLRGCYGWLGI